MNGEIVWVEERAVRAVHAAQIAEHGGASGVRDLEGLRAALARPQLLVQYEKPDLADLAACYAAGIARRHPFVDGNKRTAFVVLELFLALNGAHLGAEDAACIESMLTVAAGEMSEAAFSEWIRTHLR